MAIHMSQAFIDDASDHQALQIHRVSHGVVAADVGMHPVAATGGIVKPVIETIFSCAGEVKYAFKQFCPLRAEPIVQLLPRDFGLVGPGTGTGTSEFETGAGSYGATKNLYSSSVRLLDERFVAVSHRLDGRLRDGASPVRLRDIRPR